MALFPNSRYADTVGNGTGTKNAAALDGSSTPAILRIAPGPGEIFKITRLIPTVEDTGNLDSGGYGNGSALTNGIEVFVKRFVGEAGVTTLWDVTDGIPIKTNAAWKTLCFDENLSTYGLGNQLVAWRYSFFYDNDGDPLILSGDNKEELQIVFNDLMTFLVNHYFRIGMSAL
ncbi:hypothetical protein KAR91_54065 [Candidatus Pacearchaeota archaeon]|nr:hypothetical protein [Candidatus Pacearchaeota archaeon]